MDRVEENLRAASILIVLASPNSVTRPWINFEAGGGWIRGARVMPVCIRGMLIGALPQPLMSLQSSEISSPDGVRDFFLGVARVLDLTCAFTDWAEVGKELERANEALSPPDISQSMEMPETWSKVSREFGWIAELSDPEMYAIASNLFAVRQTCRELLYQSERSPHLYSHPSQSACRLFSKAVKSLQKKYGAKFIFEPLDDSEGHSTTPSPGWLLALSDNVLKFIQVQERSEKA